MFALATLSWLATAACAADVPYLTGRVVDNAEILKPATRAELDRLLQAHESATTDQIAILTTRSLGGESIEQYAQQVFGAWKLGQKGKDNGILLVVAPSEHKMRIEVGYGLEGSLPDVIAARIIRDIMTPPFKSGDYDAGVQKGAAAIVAQLEGHGDSLGLSSSVATDAPHALLQFDAPSNTMPWPMRILVGCFVFGIIGLFTVAGVMTPGVGWFLYLFLIPFWAMFPLFILGGKPTLALLAIYVIGFPIAKLIAGRQPWYAKAAADLKRTGTAHVGGMVLTSGSSFSGGSFGGGSSGGGGGSFSGGGGSSGGGGASGSW
ncbi:MAG: YgcG family protein [Casimicrobiaceae bacterium]